MTARACAAAIAVAVTVAGAAVAAAQAKPETFSATASAKSGSTSVTTTVSVTVDRYSSPAERDSVMSALKSGGTKALRQTLEGFPAAGVLDIGGRRTPIKFAGERPTSGGRLITVVTAEPILYLGGGLPSRKAPTGFDVAIAMFEFKDDGSGMGDVSPAAKVGLDDHGALLIEDYGATVVWLTKIARVK